MKRLWLLSILFLAPSVSGCGCTAELLIHYDPDTVTLSVGETAPPPQISTSGCLAPSQTVEILEWKAENPEIVLVATDTGVITGVATGKTRIVGYEEENFRNAFGIPVTVIASPTATR